MSGASASPRATPGSSTEHLAAVWPTWLLLTSAAISLLQRHRAVPAGLLHLGGNLVGHLGGARAFFLRVAEDAEALELRLADEVAQFVDVGLGFAGEADDEGRAQRDAGDAGADALDEVADVGAARLALHRVEHVVADVLQRHVDVAGDLRALGDGPDELVAPVRRMRVEQADPEIALDGVAARAGGW